MKAVLQRYQAKQPIKAKPSPKPQKPITGRHWSLPDPMPGISLPPVAPRQEAPVDKMNSTVVAELARLTRKN